MEKLAYLVPHDFSEVGTAATRQGLQLARQTKGTVHILHIIKAEGERKKAQEQLDAIVKSLNLAVWDPSVTIHIEAGNIFEDIAKVAKKINASAIIMGTHGAKGMQKLFGSFAIKVINSTDVPFIIVQDKMPAEKLTKIIFPVDLSAESIQIMNSAGNLALDYDAEIIIIAPQETDAALKRKITIHLEVVKKQLTKRNVKHTINFVPKSKTFYTTVIDFAKKQNAELIAIAYYTESMLPQFDPFAQSIITNEAKIPVLIIKSKQVGSMYF